MNNDRWASYRARKWSGMHRRVTESKHYSHVSVEMTREEFYSWLNMRREKIESMLSQGLKPSIDRINNKIGYRLNNIQLIDTYENTQKPNIERSMPVISVNLKTGEKREYPSVLATKEAGFDISHVHKICSKKPMYKTHRGHKFFFKNEEAHDQENLITTGRLPEKG